MNFYHILAAILIALAFTLIFSVGLKNKGPWGTLWFTFLVLFLSSWAGFLWLKPIGPLVFGIPMVPSLFIALVIAFALAAVSYTSLPPGAIEQSEKEAKTLPAAIGVFFWLLVIVLITAIVVGYCYV